MGNVLVSQSSQRKRSYADSTLQPFKGSVKRQKTSHVSSEEDVEHGELLVLLKWWLIKSLWDWVASATLRQKRNCTEDLWKLESAFRTCSQMRVMQPLSLGRCSWSCNWLNFLHAIYDLLHLDQHILDCQGCRYILSTCKMYMPYKYIN